MGRESLQKLWQKYKVDIAFYGHVHNYERTYPIYQNQCVNKEKQHYSGTVNGTIHVVVGGAGSHLSKFSDVITNWSLYRDYDFGFVKMRQHLTIHMCSMSTRRAVMERFMISRDYKDVLAYLNYTINVL
ncbi:hypothetical protein LWI28_024863 [Acer negundo]|uniref:Purple acid phosphatase C-terminal domain-containing protein n=1 Tax=Acer negundo TaxID=4023 RepID=A0AAD5IRF2_ACENE|nr:hypothetical protein LWI28_024863 [Acer negundo]